MSSRGGRPKSTATIIREAGEAAAAGEKAAIAARAMAAKAQEYADLATAQLKEAQEAKVEELARADSGLRLLAEQASQILEEKEAANAEKQALLQEKSALEQALVQTTTMATKIAEATAPLAAAADASAAASTQIAQEIITEEAATTRRKKYNTANSAVLDPSWVRDGWAAQPGEKRRKQGFGRRRSHKGRKERRKSRKVRKGRRRSRKV